MLTNRFLGWMLLSTLLAAGLACIVLPVSAQQSTYDVRHDFSVQPGGDVVPRVEGRFMALADVQQGDVVDWDFTFGTFRASSAGTDRTETAHAGPLPSEAEGNSRFHVGPFGVGGTVSGWIRSDGFARLEGLDAARAYSESRSQIMIWAGTALRNGTVFWTPMFTNSVSGSAAVQDSHKQPFVCDPVIFRITDLESGQVLDDKLVEITYEIKGDGSVSWQGGSLEVNGYEADRLELHVLVGSSYTYSYERGTLDLVVEGGMVTTSYDDGIFDGCLPPVGSSGSFVVPITSQITLHYDYGDFNGHQLDVFLHLGGGGGGYELVEAQDVANLRELQAIPDEMEVNITEAKVVTAASGTLGNRVFYIEDEGRAAGIRAILPQGAPMVNLGDRITLSGIMCTDPMTAERYVDVTSIPSTVPGLPINPLGMVNRSMPNDSEMGGIDVTGLLVRAWGRVTFREPHDWYIYVDDGSGLDDGSGHVGIRVMLNEQSVPIMLPQDLDYVGVTGLAGRTNGWIPCIRPRDDADMFFFDFL